MASVFTTSNAVRTLKPALQLGAGVTLFGGALNPSSSAFAGNPGDVYFSTSTLQTYTKQDSGSTTNWVAVSGGTGGGGGTTTLSGEVTGVSSNTTVASIQGITAANIALGVNAANSATNVNTVSTLVKRDSSGNFSAGTITASLRGSVDVASGTLSLGTSGATTINVGNASSTTTISGQLQVADLNVILNKGGATSSGIGSGISIEENSVLTGYAQTSSNRNSWTFKAPNTAGIVTITPGSAGFTIDQASHNPVTIGTANGLSLSTQTLSLALASTSVTGALSSTDWNTFNSKQAAGSYITTLTGDVTSSAFTGGSVTATVASVGGVSSTNVAAGANLANNATDLNTASRIVKRDASGNFSAGTITATLNGNANNVTQTVAIANGGTGATTAPAARTNLLPSQTGNTGKVLTSNGTDVYWSTPTGGSGGTTSSTLAGDVTGTTDSSVVSFVGTSTAANVHAAELLANAATNLNTVSTIVKRDGNGDFSARDLSVRNITATGTLSGSLATSNLTGTVAKANGGTGADNSNVIFPTTGTITTNADIQTLTNKTLALASNTISSTAARAAQFNSSTGALEASTVTATQLGYLSGVTSAIQTQLDAKQASGNYITALTGDVTTSGSIATVALVNGMAAASVASGASAANSASVTANNTIVKRDSSGNFSAGTITAALNGNANTATSAGTLTGNLSGEVTSTGMTTLVASVNGVAATSISAGATLANNATNLNTPSALVKRDASGNFSAGTISATLNGNANNVTGVVAAANGGTGQNLSAASGVLKAASGVFSASTITDADISSSAAITLSKLAALGTSRAVVSDSSGILAASATTATQIGYLSTATSNIQTQINSKATKSTGDIDETSFTASNNQVAATDVTGLAFSTANVRSARIYLSVYVNATASTYEFFTLDLLNAGASGWYMAASSIGDTSGFGFTVTSAGQVQYTSTNNAGFVAATVKFRAVTLSV